MIRAVLFDFYGVWRPDIFSQYLAETQRFGPEATAELQQVVQQYFSGQIGPKEVAEAFRLKLSRPDIDTAEFSMQEAEIMPAIADFMRGLHGHFLKLGVLANLGQQEYQMLYNYNQHNQLFEVIAGPLAYQLNAPLLSQEVFARALQEIGEPPKSCLAVSGSQAYLDFAASIGMTPMPFQGFGRLKEDIDKLVSTEAG